MVALLFVWQIATAIDEATQNAAPVADVELPDWLNDQQISALNAALEEQLQRDLIRFMVDERVAKGDGKIAYWGSQAELLDGSRTPELGLMKTQPPEGMSRLQSTDRLIFSPLTIVDGSTLLVETSRPGRIVNTRVERIWINGVGTSKVTSDDKALSIDSLCVEMANKSYVTALGTTAQVRQVRVISDEFIGLLWAKHFKTIKPETIEEWKSAASIEARKRARKIR